MKTVGDIMSTDITSCHPRTPMRSVAQRMRNADVSALPVLDDEDHLVGIISQTDLVTLRAYREEWEEMFAEHVMVRNVLTTTPDTDIKKASDVMVSNKVHRLIVCEDDSQGKPRLVGILSMTDVVREMATDDVPEEDLPGVVDTPAP